MELGQDSYIVRNANGHALAYVYFEDDPGPCATAKLLTRDEARRVVANIARLPGSNCLSIKARPTSGVRPQSTIRYRVAY